MVRLDLSERYIQLSRILEGRQLALSEIKDELSVSENYARKLVSDLVLSGNIIQTKVKSESWGRPVLRFTWAKGSVTPTEYTRKISAPVIVKNSDPLILALYSHLAV